MPERMFDRVSLRPASPISSPVPSSQAPARPGGSPDAAYAALPRLVSLRDALDRVAKAPSTRWKTPPLFFFTETAQTDGPMAVRGPVRPRSADPLDALTGQIAAEMPGLCRSVEVRRVARSVNGLRAAAEAVAPRSPAARELATLLAVPDDEVVLVICPERRTAVRVAVRGVADVGQFHVLLAAAIGERTVNGPTTAGDITELPNELEAFSRLEFQVHGPATADDGWGAVAPVPSRFVAACRNSGPPIPAGIPMTFEARFQLYTHSALQPDGTLPDGPPGCRYRLWPENPLAAIPRALSERIILVGPTVNRGCWETGARFAGLAADLRLVETLGAFRTAEEMGRLTGRPIPPVHRREPVRTVAKAA